MTGILTEQKLISDYRYRVIESSSLVPVLFREVFSHPYISLFHLLVNGFSVIYIYIYVYSVQQIFIKIYVLRGPSLMENNIILSYQGDRK